MHDLAEVCKAYTVLASRNSSVLNHACELSISQAAEMQSSQLFVFLVSDQEILLQAIE